MCDTMVALGHATAGGQTIFAKNSDREPDEAQNILFVPRAAWPADAKVKCTYSEIPQVAETAAVLLSQPFWMWGAEMGVNEHGVAIGNEAIFTRGGKGEGELTGMDLVRLGLERGRTAAHAREVITELLENHGQGGKCGYRNRFSYMNSFLIADAGEAFVLETFHYEWIWRRVDGLGVISNFISMDNKFNAVSPSLIENGIKLGWCRGRDDFYFKILADPVYTYFAYGVPRACRSLELLQAKNGALTPADFFRILRDHGPNPAWRPYRQKSGTLCMHAANNFLRPIATTGSLVAILQPDPVVFVTGASNPCLSPFFPARVAEGGVSAAYSAAGADYSDAAWWWISECAHRRALPRFAAAHSAALAAIQPFEAEMLKETGGGTDAAGVAKWFERAREVVADWGTGLDALPPERLPFFQRRYWDKRNQWNKIPA